MQKYLQIIKAIVVVSSVAALGYLVVNTSPTVPTITMFALTLEILFLTLLSVFLATRSAFLLSLGVVFLVFLKAVDLLSLVNVGLFGLFLVLLGVYLYKRE